MQPRDVAEHLHRPDARPGAAVLEHHADAGEQLASLALRVEPEDRDRALLRPAVALAGLQRRGLAGAVGSEHGRDRVPVDGEVEVVDGDLARRTASPGRSPRRLPRGPWRRRREAGTRRILRIAGSAGGAGPLTRSAGGVSRPLTYAAWPRCCRQSPTRLTSRTPAVTGGSQCRSTTRSSSSASTPAEVLERQLVHGLVVVHERPEVVDPHRVDLLGGVAVADVAGVEAAGRTPRPSRRARPVAAGEPGDVVVLDPGGVPEQPDDRVAGPAGAVVGALEVEIVGDVDVELADAAEGVSRAALRSPCRRRPWSAPVLRRRLLSDRLGG